MFLFLLWLLTGAVVITLLVVGGAKIDSIENAFSRRIALVVSLVITIPAFILLLACDHFLRFVEGDVADMKAAALGFLKDSTVGFYHDLKEVW